MSDVKNNPAAIKTMRQLHAEWATLVLPFTASAVQRQEMERAFYAGALTFFMLQTNEIAVLSDDQAERALSVLYNEMDTYFKLMETIPGLEGAERQ